MDLIIKNGTIVTAEATFKGDIGVKNGKIKSVGVNLDPAGYKGATVVDAKGLLVLPGAIDGHVHLEMPFGGTISADSYEAGTRAAACGELPRYSTLCSRISAKTWLTLSRGETSSALHRPA